MTALREQMQRAQRAPRGRAVPFRVDVLDLVHWVYAEQRAHLCDGRGIGLHEGERAAAGLVPHRAGVEARIAETLALGTMIQKQGYDSGELHPIAELVHSLVLAVHGGLIIRFAPKRESPPGGKIEAKIGPYWKGAPRYAPDGLPLSGAFHVVYDANKRPTCCLLAVDHEPEYIQQLREEYRAWHAALGRLVRACAAHQDKLGNVLVTGPAIAAEPWALREYDSDSLSER